MLPILFKIGPLPIYSFGCFLALGYVVFTFLIYQGAKKEYFDEEKVFDVVFLSTIGAILGARLFYIIEHFDSFGFSFLNWILVNAIPGFSFWGGIGVGLSILLLSSRKEKLPLYQILDLLTRPLLLLFIFGEIGAFLAGNEIGLPTKLPWGVIFFSTLKRHPISAYQVIASLILLVIFLRLGKIYKQKKMPSGSYFFTFIILQSLLLFIIAFLKEDAIVIGRVFKIESFLYLAIIFTTVVIFYRRLSRNLKNDLLLLKTKFIKNLKPKKTYEKISS